MKKEYRYKKEDLFSKVIWSEIFCQKELANYLGVNRKDIELMTVLNDRHPYDLRNKNDRYDVKFSEPGFPNRDKTLPVWEFCLRKKGHDYCEYYLLLGLINGNPERLFLIPTSTPDLPSKYIRISIFGKSKYNEFVIRDFNRYKNRI